MLAIDVGRKDRAMTTDDERREVARKLTEAAECVSNDDDIVCVLNDILRGEEKRRGINEDCTVCRRATLVQLADLIGTGIPVDPGEAGLASVDGFIRERTGKPVDRDALLELADDLDHAGANVENVAYIDQTLHDAARRIRETLGRVENDVQRLAEGWDDC